MNCPCGSEKLYAECCEPLIRGVRSAETPELLMRSRYSAYVTHEVPYIMETSAPETRSKIDESAVTAWSNNTTWRGLEILKTETAADGKTGMVEFIAQYKETGAYIRHHEIATFEKINDIWYFVDGTHPKPEQVISTGPKVGRNDPCVCGSGKKYKKCCGVNS